MYKVELDPTLCRIMEIYRRVGIWRNDGESDFRSSSMRVLYFFLYCLFSVYILTGAYISEDRNQKIFLVGIAISLSIITVKLAYLLWRKDEMLMFLDDPIMAHYTEDYGEAVIINQKIKSVAVFCKVYTLIIIVTLFIVVLLALPIFPRDVKMLPGFIPFTLESDYDTILYWMAFIYGAVSSYLSGFYSLATLFVWYIMLHYAIEYKLLGHRLRSLGTKIPNAYHQELIHLIRAYTNLLE